MNVLVTGSAGMIGEYVVKDLIGKEHSIIGVRKLHLTQVLTPQRYNKYLKLQTIKCYINFNIR